ncbi:Transaldolase like protein [Verticillium longisporum]|nr:Transaldolase like protein [Verticillium longisporum]
MPSQLEGLRKASKISCDTLDVQVAKELGPFVDVTSNQAIAAGELARTAPDGTLIHEQIIRQSAWDALAWLPSAVPGGDPVTFAVEIMMVRLSIQFAPYKRKTVDPTFDTKRVCVKIPATFEGIGACRILENDDIPANRVATLATTLFCMEQAVLAANARCTYIAPYVNELKVHFEPGYVDQNKAFDFTRQAQHHYAETSARTQVLAASLTSTAEVLQLAGIHHITVSPPLLRGLSDSSLPSEHGKLGAYFAAGPGSKFDRKAFDATYRGRESAYRILFSRSGHGSAEVKLNQAINIFCDKQDELEEVARRALEEAMAK